MRGEVSRATCFLLWRCVLVWVSGWGIYAGSMGVGGLGSLPALFDGVLNELSQRVSTQPSDRATVARCTGGWVGGWVNMHSKR